MPNHVNKHFNSSQTVTFVPIMRSSSNSVVHLNYELHNCEVNIENQ